MHDTFLALERYFKHKELKYDLDAIYEYIIEIETKNHTNVFFNFVQVSHCLQLSQSCFDSDVYTFFKNQRDIPS